MKIKDIATGNYTDHWVSFGYYAKDGKVHTNAFVDGVAYGHIPPLGDIEDLYNRTRTAESHFFNAIILDASTAKKNYDYGFVRDVTYIITCSKGLADNEVAVWVVNTRNNTCVVTTLKSVSGITYAKNSLTFGVYAEAGIVAELSCIRL